MRSESGRTGQSDLAHTNLQASAYVPLGNKLTWAVHLRANDAHVLKRQEAFDTPEEVAGELNVNCDEVVDVEGRADCEALARDLAEFIAASNRSGTTAPLGGSTSLRAYREARFRAAHTRLFATEFRLAPTPAFEIAVFWERGQAADRTEELSSPGSF